MYGENQNLIMQEDRWKPLKEMNLTDDFLFDVATHGTGKIVRQLSNYLLVCD